MNLQSYIEYMQAYSATHTHSSGCLYSISIILVLGIRVMGLVFRMHYGNGKSGNWKIAEGIYMKFNNGKFY
jgi:hypothetical protein